MLNINLSRPVEKSKTFSRHLYIGFIMAMAAVGASADDEIIEVEPDNTLISKVADFLFNLWDTIHGLLY